MGALHKLIPMHNKTYLFMPIESTARELDYKVNIARHFCAQGLDVIIGNPPFIRDELKYKNYRSIFIEKGINPDPEYYASLFKKGVYLYDLNDEGASKPVHNVTYPAVNEAMAYMRTVFLWGDFQRTDLMNRNSNPSLISKYKVIGNPGFDLCFKQYKKLNHSLKPKSLPASYILINTNFGCHNSYGIEEHIKACKLMSPMSLEMMQNAYQKEEKQFGIIREWLHNIIQEFTMETFLIRPHPGELENKYRSEFGKYHNVIISKEGNANHIISCAKIVLHKDCTTAMQSHFMGVPVISLGGHDLSKEYEAFPLVFSALPNTIEEAKQLIRYALMNGKLEEKQNKEIDRQAKEIVDSMFYNIGNSTKGLLEHIRKDAQTLFEDETPYKIINSRTRLQRLKVFIRKFMPLHYKLSKATRQTMVEFTKEDICKRLSLLESADPLASEYHVTKIFPNAFKISKRH